jgi:peptidylprolyl isomerase
MRDDEREPEEGAQDAGAQPEKAPFFDAENAESGQDLPDYYAVLGVRPGSGRRIVAETYDRLSRELQPDENAPPTDPDRVREIDEAFDVLDDPQRRAEYDRARGIALAEAGPARRPDRRTLLALGLILGGVAAIVAAGAFLTLAILDEGGASCAAAGGQTVTTANGVEYKDITVCDGPPLSNGDIVDVNYIGSLEDGTEFANTYDSGDAFRFPYGQAAVINGWDEGLAGMTVGSKRQVKIPSDVYGEGNVSADVIPPGSTLVFEIKVEARVPGASPTPALPTQVPTTAPDAPPEVGGEEVTTASGLKYIDIVPGGGQSASPGSTVIVNYTGWLADGGSKFDSSLERQQPFSFTLGVGDVIAGWDEGLATMKVGGKRRLIIPPDLGYGAGGSPPVIPENATLIFDVELLDVR